MKEIKEFNWSKATKPPLEEYFPADKLGRARYATFLSRLLAQEGYDESNTNRLKNLI